MYLAATLRFLQRCRLRRRSRGCSCLPILDSERIAAATVAADSACIGDGQSTLTQGIISAVNDAAYRLGARVGETALDVARTVAERA